MTSLGNIGFSLQLRLKNGARLALALSEIMDIEADGEESGYILDCVYRASFILENYSDEQLDPLLSELELMRLKTRRDLADKKIREIESNGHE